MRLVLPWTTINIVMLFLYWICTSFTFADTRSEFSLLYPDSLIKISPQYRQFAPAQDQISENRARALLQFAGKTILKEIHERNRKHTLSYIKTVGENRRSYMALYKKKLISQLGVDVSRFKKGLNRSKDLCAIVGGLFTRDSRI